MKQMKKTLLATGISLLALLSSCTNQTTLPQNPKDKEERRDSHGHFWIYNAAFNRWAVSSNSASNPPMYYYYPGNNSWTNSNGLKIDAPKGISQSFYKPSSKPNSSGSKYGTGPKSSTGKAFKSGTTRSFGA